MNATLAQRQIPHDSVFYLSCQPAQRTPANRRRDERLRLLSPGLRLNELSTPCQRCSYDRTGPVVCDWCGHVTLST